MAVQPPSTTRALPVTKLAASARQNLMDALVDAGRLAAAGQVLIESAAQGRTEHFLSVAVSGETPGTDGMNWSEFPGGTMTELAGRQPSTPSGRTATRFKSDAAAGAW